MRVLQIQGLRALAAVVVTFFHARLVSGGFIGVDIFYVISGYLITGLILREIESTGCFNLTLFYQRRIKRLLPTSVFVLLITALVAWFVLSPISRGDLGRDLFAAAAYVSNYLFAWWQNDYQNLNATPSPFIHYWSLAVEEQFYLLWPIFIIALARKGKRAIFIGISIATTLSLVFSIFQTNSSPIWAFYSLPTRAWELGVGALLLFMPKSIFKQRLLPWLGLSALFFAFFIYNDNTAFPGFNALLPVVATALLIATIPVWPPIFNAVSNNGFAQWLGKISYPLYLWHWPALVLPSSALGRPLHLMERMACICLTVVLAHLTNKFIEEPFRNIKIAPKKLYLGALGTTCTSLIIGVLIATTSTATISTTGDHPLRFDLTQIKAKPAVYGDGCHVNFGETKSGYCTYGDKNSSTTIVLYGDSHAAQWFPALEKLAIDKSFRLISLTKSSCASVDALRHDQGAFKSLDCERWRENSIMRIRGIHPAAVIMSSFEYYTPPTDAHNRAQWWSNGQEKLLASLQGASDHLIYLSDTPHPLRDIPACLASRSSNTCDSTEKSSVSVVKGFQVINPTPWLCASNCPAIVDSIVAYRDASHISVAMAVHLAPNLLRAFKANGLFA